MKYLLFFIGLFGSFYVSATMFPDTEMGNNRQDKENRSISNENIEIEAHENYLRMYILSSLGDIYVQVLDDSGVVIHESNLSVNTPMSYDIPLNKTYKWYRIVISGSNINEDVLIYKE